MDWSTVSHDELIAEVQKRLSEGHFGYNGLYSDNQRSAQDHMREFTHWLEGQVELHRLSTSGYGDALRMVRQHLGQCTDVPKPPFRVHAINTTFYGKDEVHQDHSPRAA